MRVTGIIAEYNPFHNGHAYHIREAKAQTGCDYLIVAMSGDFVQRGTPALLDRYVRAEAALLAGADMVLQLPTYTSTASAEFFARGGVKLFDSIGVTTHLSYGIEVPMGSTPEATQQCILRIASYLADEPEDYKQLLREKLAEGVSFPLARAYALGKCIPDSQAVLALPNNILAIEYEKQKILLPSNMCSAPIARIGSGYHDDSPGHYCSATAIRKQLLEKHSAFPYDSVPAELKSLYENNIANALLPDDFSNLLFARLQPMSPQDIAAISDIGEESARRIYKASRTAFSYTSLGEQVKERSHTRTHVDRALCHLLLDITKEASAQYEAYKTTPYVQVLGMRSSAKPLLSAISANTATPLLVRLASDVRTLSGTAAELYALEDRASAMYSQALYASHGLVRSDYQRRFLMHP